ncbi:MULTISPECIES: S9 family peptidase [unclassified Microbacterium]|uniref:alpha/beta hydrolase family protein n=1 Tax=unclassified Microbacterium TaxID=2609290 RepID=UPI00160508A2|nr:MULTISPECIES: alpha/beta hydrolase [unclassified Microbacterium]QNA93679.1 alpha/beta fold hydrolase [Microbacterium sp. Se63.02b]QYM63962.1 alpha/beta fold hydrolase [Microbacterium sp. Se5.02b]
MDYLITDPEPGDGTPATTRHVALRSSGHELHGVLHLPAGPGPHAVLLLLHGFPGWERNFDIAHALRRAGVASLVFHYRGCWGMPGDWSWANALADTEAVLDALLRGDHPQMPELDPLRVGVAGHSLGGFLALYTASTRPDVRATVSISGFDFGAVAAAVDADPALLDVYTEAFASETPVLSNTDGRRLAHEMRDAGQEWSLRALADRFTDRDVLLIGTSRDEVTPSSLHHDPLVAAFDEAQSRLRHTVFPSDHSLADHRVRLSIEVVDFARARLSRPVSLTLGCESSG